MRLMRDVLILALAAVILRKEKLQERRSNTSRASASLWFLKACVPCGEENPGFCSPPPKAIKGTSGWIVPALCRSCLSLNELAWCRLSPQISRNWALATGSSGEKKFEFYYYQQKRARAWRESGSIAPVILHLAEAGGGLHAGCRRSRHRLSDLSRLEELPGGRLPCFLGSAGASEFYHPGFIESAACSRFDPTSLHVLGATG